MVGVITVPEAGEEGGEVEIPLLSIFGDWVERRFNGRKKKRLNLGRAPNYFFTSFLLGRKSALAI